MSFVISIGKYGGWHFQCLSSFTELTLGWISFEIWNREVISVINELLDEIDNRTFKVV